LLGLVEEGDAVVLRDLDEFKALNDVRDHQAGDDALAAFGTIVREVLRSGEVAIRYGGDEILLVLTRAGSEARTPRSRGYVHVGLV
jgi:diguanylate cyclase (GGDEF)-like protein